MKQGPPLEPDRGFALLIVLWTMVLLALLATQLTASGRGEARLALNLRAAATVEAAADGAFNTALFHVLDASDRHWRADGAAHTLGMPGAVAEIRIANEGGKINLNTAQPEVLAALLHSVGADTATSRAIANAIVTWRFPDAGRDPAAKRAAYLGAGRGYAPPNAPFEDVAELGLVIGMTPDLLARMAPHLTIFHDGEPDIRLAGPVVRQALTEAGGGVPPDPGGNVQEDVFEITAQAVESGGGRFLRRGIVKRGLRPETRPFNLLTWESG